MNDPRPTLSELEATVRKAVRGFGCPWGVAEDAGRSARWLAAYGLPGAEAVAGALGERERCCCAGDAPCALRRALGFGDRLTPNAAARAEDVTAPLLELAQAGRAAAALDTAYRVDWGAGCATVCAAALTLEGSPDADGGPLTCAPYAPDEDGLHPSPASRPVDPAAWEALRRLAARLLVPSDERSRAGAGAGTRDDD